MLNENGTKTSFITKKSLSWAMYDWANSVFTLVVITGFYPVIYGNYWASSQSSEAVTFQLGTANSLASVVIVLAAPVLGAFADCSGAKKRLLALFAWMGILITCSLYWVQAGGWQVSLVLFTLGVVSYMAANVVYDALLINVSDSNNVDMISSLGYALGYIGSALMFVFCYWMTQDPTRFGLEDGIEAIRVSFLLVAIWWALFSIPVLMFVDEKPGEKMSLGHAMTSGFRQVISTIKSIRQHRAVAIFLLAYFLYIDGVDTIIRMAIDYGRALEFDTSSMLTALLLTQFVAFPATLIFGWLGKRFGTRLMLLVGIGVYMLVTVWASLIRTEQEFYYIAIMIGLVQGGVQSLSRALYTRLIPADRVAEFFGFYNIMGKSAVFLGPLLMGTVTVMTGSHRLGILVLLVFFIAGALVLLKVPMPESAEGNHASTR